MPSISLEELHAYHAIDREIFSRMVIRLARKPSESLLIMAIWLWLEDMGFSNMASRLVHLSDLLVNAIADEAVLCLKCLESDSASLLQNRNIPLTARVMERNISLQYFIQNKFLAIVGVKSFLNTACSRIFTDILEFALSPKKSPILFSTPTKPLEIPGFPHPVFGSINIFSKAIDLSFSVGGLWGWDSSMSGSEDDRTMFLTFSRGFPVTPEEVSDLFTRLYGECVIGVQMQENVPENEQPLFARMILNSVAAVDKILNGKRIAKYRINGKHIWARKYERRE